MHRVELKVNACPCVLSANLLFLMHRVELKAYSFLVRLANNILVPNAPCGVERFRKVLDLPSPGLLFLMYRVELKEASAGICGIAGSLAFLMYRVELKGEKLADIVLAFQCS